MKKNFPENYESSDHSDFDYEEKGDLHKDEVLDVVKTILSLKKKITQLKKYPYF